MTTVAIKSRLHAYIETADDKHLKAIYVLLEKEMALASEYDAATLEMLYRRRDNDLQGLSKSYSIDEAIESVRNAKNK